MLCDLLSKVANAAWSAALDDELNAGIEKLRQIGALSGLGISNEERVMIVRAIGFSQGHWYKCPNGALSALSLFTLDNKTTLIILGNSS